MKNQTICREKRKLLFKQSNQFILLIALISFNQIYSQKSIWQLYSPVQSNVVGKVVMGKKGMEYSIGEISISPTITTKDDTSANYFKKDFNSNFKLAIEGFLGDYAKVQNIEASGLVKTTLVNDWTTLNSGDFVFAGIKANTVTVTFSKTANTEISPSKIFEKVKGFSSISPANVLNALTLIDSINFSKNKSFVMIIKNPNVYYTIQVVRISEMYGPSDYYINMLGKRIDTLTLSQSHKTTLSAEPVISPEFEKTTSKIKVDLIRKMENGKVKLFARYTDEKVSGPDKSVPIEIPMFDDESWDSPSFLVHTYSLGNTGEKKIWLSIKAEKVGSNILLKEATLTYPEKVFKILTGN